MAYLGTSINQSPVISRKAGAILADCRGRALKFDSNGDIIQATAATDIVIGIGIMNNEENIQVGYDVDVQIKDMGVVRSGGVFAAGDELTTDANGQFVKATTGNVAAIAIQASTKAGEYVQVMLAHYAKAAAAG